MEPKEPNVCELHKELKNDVDKNKFIRNVFGSKVFISILSFVFLTLISWCIWVTNCIYVRAADQSIEKTVSQKASKDMDEVKIEMKEIKNEVKNQTETFNKNQQDMLRLLIEIQKEQRRSNGEVKKGGAQ